MFTEKERKALQQIEYKVFQDDIYYIFASENMRDYAIKKFALSTVMTDVCINGGTEVIPCDVPYSLIDQNRINYVYAGTLNKGRQIEKMIESFPDDEHVHLYLLGPMGEWIDKLQNNITYLGALEEKSAHYFVSMCDVGIIPYDETRLYYNIAYPTKLSFYITADIAYLSTPVDEVMKTDKRVQGGWLAPFSEWTDIYLSVTKADIRIKKETIMHISDEYLWDAVLAKNKFIH